MKSTGHSFRNCRATPQAGFSLVELMISLTIGLLILAGIGYAYLGSRANFRGQDALSRMQENARAVFEMMARDLRMAGFTGCDSTTPVPAGANWYQNPAQPLAGYENTAETTIAPSAAAYGGFPAGLAGVQDFVLQGDVLTVVRADSSQQYIVSSTYTASSSIPVSPAPSFGNGETLLGVQCGSGMDLLSCASAAGCQSSPFNTSVAPTYTIAGSTIYPLSAAAYFVSSNDILGITAGDTQPRLFRQTLQNDGSIAAMELAEGVQDLQFSYAVDTDCDGNVDIYQLASGIASGTACNTTAATWGNVLGVRVSLLMVSRQSEQGITPFPQQYQLDINGDGVYGTGNPVEVYTPTDNLLRMVFTTTIAIKNRL